MHKVAKIFDNVRLKKKPTELCIYINNYDASLVCSYMVGFCKSNQIAIRS